MVKQNQKYVLYKTHSFVTLSVLNFDIKLPSAELNKLIRNVALLRKDVH